MTLTLLRYRDSPGAPHAVAEVSDPHDAVTLLRAWQQSFPDDRGMVLDEKRRPIATSQCTTDDRSDTTAGTEVRQQTRPGQESPRDVAVQQTPGAESDNH